MIGPVQQPRRWPWPNRRNHTAHVMVPHEGLSKSAAVGKLRICYSYPIGLHGTGCQFFPDNPRANRPLLTANPPQAAG
jgi:hypothetical protein